MGLGIVDDCEMKKWRIVGYLLGIIAVFSGLGQGVFLGIGGLLVCMLLSEFEEDKPAPRLVTGAELPKAPKEA